MRLTGFSWLATAIPVPEASVTLLRPGAIAMSAVTTPSTTYNGFAVLMSDVIPRRRMRLPPPGAPVFC